MGRTKSDQIGSTHKDRSDKPDRSSHKTRPKTKQRPKLEKHHSEIASTSPPWGYDQHFMYNQQGGGPYSVQGTPRPITPLPPMLANGPAYVYGHPNQHQMMAYNAEMMAANTLGQQPYRRSGASNVKYMQGNRFDPRLYGQMRSASMDEFSLYIPEEDERQSDKEDTEGTDEASNYVPSTPRNALSRTNRLKSVEDDKDGARTNEGGPSSPVRDAPSPVYDEPITNTADATAGSESSGRTKHKMQRSKTQKELLSQKKREILGRRRGSLISISPTDPSAPILLTDVWNDGAPTEVNRIVDRRVSVQDNHRAVLENLKEMEERELAEDKMTKKTSIASSFKRMFKRRK